MTNSNRSRSIRRRTLLQTSLPLLGALAGCTSGAESGSSETTADKSDTFTTISSKPETPVLEKVNPITTWNQMGDVIEYEVHRFGVGGIVPIGIRAHLRTNDQGEAKHTTDITVYDEGDTEIDSVQVTDSGTGGASDTIQIIETFAQIDTKTYDKGRYRASVTVTDEIAGIELGPAETTFELVEPLSASEAELISVEHPESVSRNTQWRFKLKATNTTTKPNSIVSTLSWKHEDDDKWITTDQKVILLNLRPDEPRTWTSNPISPDKPGIYTFRVDALDETFEVEVTGDCGANCETQ